VRQFNPFQLRQFCQGARVLAKNEPLDARLIASFVGVMPTRSSGSGLRGSEHLVEMLAVRSQECAEKTAAENASILLEDRCGSFFARRPRIARLAADHELLEQRLVKIVGTVPRSRIDTAAHGDALSGGPFLAALELLSCRARRRRRQQSLSLVGVCALRLRLAAGGGAVGKRGGAQHTLYLGRSANVPPVLYMPRRTHQLESWRSNSFTIV